jgi:hypothetical protein
MLISLWQNPTFLVGNYYGKSKQKGGNNYSEEVLWKTMKRRMTKKITIIVKALHSKKLSALKLFHNERIKPSATVKTSLRRVRLFATAEKTSLGTGVYKRGTVTGGKAVHTTSQPPGIKGSNQANGHLSFMSK